MKPQRFLLAQGVLGLIVAALLAAWHARRPTD